MKDPGTDTVSQKNKCHNRLQTSELPQISQKNRQCLDDFINFCGDYYEKEIDFKQEPENHQEMMQEHHQFGAISFYTSAQYEFSRI